jgi:hypothetical protein
MMDYPSAEESLDRLNRSGWCVGETGFHVPGVGLAWLVVGTNGENKIRAEGRTASEAWHRALEQAAAVGMLADWPRPETGQGVRRA